MRSLAPSSAPTSFGRDSLPSAVGRCTPLPFRVGTTTASDTSDTSSWITSSWSRIQAVSNYVCGGPLQLTHLVPIIAGCGSITTPTRRNRGSSAPALERRSITTSSFSAHCRVDLPPLAVMGFLLIAGVWMNQVLTYERSQFVSYPGSESGLLSQGAPIIGLSLPLLGHRH